MAKNTILLKNYSDVFEEPLANAAVTPGHLVEPMTTGKFRVHSTAEGNVIPAFAIEDALQGKGIDDAYAEDDPMRVWYPGRGNIVNALLSNGETAVIGSKLASNGDGTLRVHDPDDSGSIQTQAIVGEAVDAVDMSGSSGADPSGRIQVRII